MRGFPCKMTGVRDDLPDTVDGQTAADSLLEIAATASLSALPMPVVALLPNARETAPTMQAATMTYSNETTPFSSVTIRTRRRPVSRRRTNELIIRGNPF